MCLPVYTYYHCFRCIRFMLRSVGVAAVAILQDVVEMVFILQFMLPVLLSINIVDANIPAVEALLFSVPWLHHS